ncbi:MAG TPA: hypothetical protein VKY62_05520, partial [Devosia sp.]|nr:hypothetical protein [Devosia sp.]
MASILVVFGLPIAAGGLWLITLGGSWYYLPAGIGLLLTAYFLFRREVAAIWTYIIVFAATVIWALWEAGLDGWAQVPRLIAPTVVLLLVLTTLPVLRGSTRRFGSGMAAAMVTLAGALGAIGVAQHSVDSAFAQEAEQPAETDPEGTPPAAAPSGPASETTPAEPADPADPAAPAAPVVPVVPTEPTEATEPVEPEAP